MSLPLLEPVWWNWYLAGILIMCLEILIPGNIIIWFGVGALGTGLFTQITGGPDWTVQFICFSLCSLVALWLGRKFIRKASPAKGTTLNQRLMHYLGKRGTLSEAIVNGQGRVRLGDTYWLVAGPDLPEGTVVEVVAVENSTLVVDKAERVQ